MKGLYESLLDNEDKIMTNTISEKIKQSFGGNKNIEVIGKTINIKPGEDATNILADVPKGYDMIFNGIKYLYIRSGVSSDTLKRIKSDALMNFEFYDPWSLGGTEHKKTILKNCNIRAENVDIFYPIKFQNCTITLSSGGYLDFRGSLKDIKELKGLKIDADKYGNVVLRLSQSRLGNYIYDYKDDEKFMAKLYKEFESIFENLLKKRQSFKIVYEKNWFIRYCYEPFNSWSNEYGW